MPLGYMKGMFNGVRTIHSTGFNNHMHNNDTNVNSIKQFNKLKNDINYHAERSFIWSFIGNYDKRDRPQMIEAMKSINGSYFLNNNTKPESMNIFIIIM